MVLPVAEMRLDSSIFRDEIAAYRYIEHLAWPKGIRCPHCDSSGLIGKLGGSSTRIGTYKCYVCRKPFTVKKGTIIERSHLPLHVWLKAIFLGATSSREIKARELWDVLEIMPKTANSLIERLEPLDTVRFEREAWEDSEKTPKPSIGTQTHAAFMIAADRRFIKFTHAIRDFGCDGNAEHFHTAIAQLLAAGRSSEPRSGRGFEVQIHNPG